MIKAVFTLLLLSLLFTLTSAAAFVFRKRTHGGHGDLMRIVWFAVLLLAILPIRVEMPGVRVPPVTVSCTEESAMTEPVSAVTVPAAGRTEEPAERPVWGSIREETEPETGASVAVWTTGRAVLPVCRAVFCVWLAGALYCMAKECAEYRRLVRLLSEYSEPCRDDAVLRVMDTCKKTVGLKRAVSVRCISGELSVTPCVCGVFRPTVYIGADCRELDETELSCIFIHELCHVRRNDMLYKLFSAAVLSVHWFNPMRKPVRAAVGEDNELACDAAVLRILGEEHIADYMESILSAAERVRRGSAVYGDTLRKRFLQSALFMAGETTPSYLKRRYLHMKKTCDKTGRGRLTVLSVLFLAVLIGVNTIVMSSCGFIRAENGLSAASAGEDVGDYTYGVLDNALHNYFGLPTYEVLTDEKLAAIRTIDVYRQDVAYIENETAAVPMIVINGEYGAPLLPYILAKSAFTDTILPAIRTVDTDENPAYSFAEKKMKAFYCEKDPADPTLSEFTSIEMRLVFPQTEKTAITVLDPYATSREQMLLFAYFYTAGLVDPAVLSEDSIRAEAAAMPGLEQAVLTFHDQTEDNAWNAAPRYAGSIDGTFDTAISDFLYLHYYKIVIENSVRQDIIAEYDVNGDGVLDSIYFTPYAKEKDRDIDEASCDKNGDGIFDWNDFPDRNGDGRIDTRDYAALDLNHNGLLDAEDVTLLEAIAERDALKNAEP